MLNEKLNNLSSIGNKNSVISVVSCILHGAKSLSSLQHYIFETIGAKNTDVTNIVLLLESLGLVTISDDNISPTTLFINSFVHDTDIVAEFEKQLIAFLIDEYVLNLELLEYDLMANSYVLPYKTFKFQYAAYRNLLISFEVIYLRKDNKYDINDILLSYIKKPEVVKLISQRRLKRILEIEEKMGADGESFVIQYETKRIGSRLASGIKQVSIYDVAAGFDIASFESKESLDNDRFIEVKTFVGSPHFYWSRNEIDKARLLRDNYYIYLVEYNKMSNINYEPLIVRDPIESIFGSDKWNKIIDSYYIELNFKDTTKI